MSSKDRNEFIAKLLGYSAEEMEAKMAEARTAIAAGLHPLPTSEERREALVRLEDMMGAVKSAQFDSRPPHFLFAIMFALAQSNCSFITSEDMGKYLAGFISGFYRETGAALSDEYAKAETLVEVKKVLVSFLVGAVARMKQMNEAAE